MRRHSFVLASIAFCLLLQHSRLSLGADESEPKPTDIQSKPAGEKNSSAGLPEGWKKEFDIPETRLDATGNKPMPPPKLKLWVEQGWLLARYETPTRGLEWQVVLAPATNPQPPEVRLDNQPPGFEFHYGKYFIREHFGRFSMLRERKTDDTPEWPRIPIPDVAKPSWLSQNVSNWQDNKWVWLGFGFKNNAADFENAAAHKYDIWVRVQHRDLPAETNSQRNGMESTRFTMDVDYHDFTFHDEGDLFVGHRSMDTEDQVLAKLASILNKRPVPELNVKQWLNAPPETALKNLQGKTVLLYFWSGADYSAQAARLQKKYKDRGLVVLAIHPAADRDKLDAVLKERNVDLPTAVDTDRKANEIAFHVRIWPTYFLIDPTGKVIQGYLDHPPEDKDVEAQLK